jgi:hypothetical protein
MRLLPSLLLSALLLQGCASTPPAPKSDNYVDPSFNAPAQGSLFVLLPVKSGSPDVAQGERLVTEQLHRQLTGAGYKVVALDDANYDVIWNQEIQAVGGIYDGKTGALKTQAYAQALAALTRRVAVDTRCAMVLKPALVMRQAHLSGIGADWDGQRRPVPQVRNYGADSRYDGSIPAISIELLGLASNGNVAFKTLGGISLPYRADSLGARFEVRPDLFADATETASGVHIALMPLLKN